VGSEYTITHKVESVEQKSDGTQALADETAVVPEVVEELAGSTTNQLLEAGSQNISQEVRDMVKSVEDTRWLLLR